MKYEIEITPSDLASQFAGEYDVITHQPYRIGDHLVRCRQCRAVIKTDYIDGECPLCGASPFVGMQFRPNETRQNENRRVERSHPASQIASQCTITPRQRFCYNRNETLLTLLVNISAILSPFPLWIDEVGRFIHDAMFGMDFLTTYVIFGTISFIVSIIIEWRNDTAELWKHSKWGLLLIFIPALCPYLLLAGIWLMIGGLSIVLAIVALALCVAVIIGLFQFFD